MSTQPQPLPYGDARFDRCQFAGKRPKAVSSETRIAFSDFVRMSVHKRSYAVARRNPIPLWVFNDDLFRQVLLVHAERRLHIHPPEHAADDERIFVIRAKEQATAIALARQLEQFIERIDAKDPDAPSEIQVANLDRQILIYRKGILGVSAAVAYKSLRLGLSSPEVGVELQMSACGVRQMLRRLNNAAKIISGELLPRKIPERVQQPSAETVNRRKAKKHRWDKHWDKHWELGAPKTADEKRQRKCALLREHSRKLQRERGRRYRLRHPGRRRRPYARPSAQRAQHRREVRRKYYWAHRETILASQQAVRAAKRKPKRTAEEKQARAIAKKKAWLAAHADYLRAYFARWRAKNREKIRAYSRVYYRRKLSLSRVSGVARSEPSGLQKGIPVAGVHDFSTRQNIQAAV